jgi:hypothetical protein
MRHLNWVFVLLLALTLVSGFGCETKEADQSPDGDANTDYNAVDHCYLVTTLEKSGSLDGTNYYQSFNSNGDTLLKVTSEEDIAYTYDMDGQLISWIGTEHDSGKPISCGEFEWDETGRLKSEISGGEICDQYYSSHCTIFEYDTRGRIVRKSYRNHCEKADRNSHDTCWHFQEDSATRKLTIEYDDGCEGACPIIYIERYDEQGRIISRRTEPSACSQIKTISCETTTYDDDAHSEKWELDENCDGSIETCHTFWFDESGNHIRQEYNVGCGESESSCSVFRYDAQGRPLETSEWQPCDESLEPVAHLVQSYEDKCLDDPSDWYGCEIRDGIDHTALVEVWDSYEGVGCVECTQDEKYRWGDIKLIIASDYRFTFSHTERCRVTPIESDVTENREIEPFEASGVLTAEQRAWVDELLTLDRNQIPCNSAHGIEDNDFAIHLYVNAPSGYLMATFNWEDSESSEEEVRMTRLVEKLKTSVLEMIGFTFVSCLDDY